MEYNLYERSSFPGRIIIIDLETTGLDPRRGHRVIEIGAVAMEGNKVKEEFCSFVQPGRNIQKKAAKVHGITDEMILDQPKAEEVFTAFQKFISDTTLVAHNMKFDISFLRWEFGRLGMGISNRTICTLQMSRRYFPHLPDYRLATIARHVLGELPDGAIRHRALDDARLTAMIWKGMMNK